jgi:hypothetical protein
MVGCVIDPMYLTSSETKSLLGLLQTLNSEAAPETRRIGAGRYLLDLLQPPAKWSEEHRRFQNRVSVKLMDRIVGS